MNKPNNSLASEYSYSRFDLSIGLSEEEKRDLEKMILDFQKERSQQPADCSQTEISQQIEEMNGRLNYLTSMFLELDRRMRPLYETIRLTCEKSELLNQRINTIIHSLHSGDKP